MQNKPNKDSHKGRLVYIATYGCQMNVRDSEAILGMMVDDGYMVVEKPELADVVLVNTCSVRAHAEERAISVAGGFKKFVAPPKFDQRSNFSRGDNHTKIIGVIGCMAQNYKEELFKRLPHLDFIAGPSEISRIPKIIEEIKKKHKRISAVDIQMARPEKLYASGYVKDKKHAYVNISEGCDNYCSYCVVPYVRGNLRHRKVENIIKEIKKLVALGIRDVTLLGQNVNSYVSCIPAYGGTGKYPRMLRDRQVSRKITFIDLLKMVNDIEGLTSFSFFTSHPKDASEKLFLAIRGLPKLKKYLHLPIQSGSDRILKLMNRGYTAGHYRKLVDKYRKIVPDGTLGTDIIVGFPTETEDDFYATRDLLKEIKFNSAYIFKYSPRPKTKAAGMPDDVPQEVKETRHQIILDMQKKISKSLKKILCILLFVYSLQFTIYSCVYGSSLSKAQEYFLRAEYERVISECQKEIKSTSRKSQTAELYYLCGQSHLNLGNVDQAEESFLKVINDGKTLSVCNKALLGLGDVYFQRGDYLKAKEFYLEAEKSNLDLRAQALYKLARAELKLSNNDLAKEHILTIKRDFPQSPEALKTGLFVSDSGNAAYTVQVGAFSSQKNASKLVSDLKGKGFDAYIAEPTAKEDALFRVRVGKFNTKEEADKVEKLLSAEGFPTKIFP